MPAWPDQRRILALALEPFGATVGRLTEDWQSRVTADTPLLHLSKVGTPDVDELGRTDRVKVDCYAIGETTAIDLAEAVLEFLAGHYHYVPDAPDRDPVPGLIDDVQVESGPVPVPQYHEEIALVTATYRCVARPLG